MPRLKILVIYQGEGAKPLCDAIKQHYADRPEENVTVWLVVDRTAALSYHTLHQYKDLVHDCDLAIAVLSVDSRAAAACDESAGNLWFELGYWIARKGADTVLLLRPNDLGPVELISDLSGLRGQDDFGWSAWHSVVGPFIDKIRSQIIVEAQARTEDYPYVSVFRGRRFARALDAVSVCTTSGQNCGFLRGTILMTAELFAIAFMSQRHLEVQDAFRRLSLCLEALVDLSEGGRDLASLRRRYANYIDETIDELRGLGQEFTRLQARVAQENQEGLGLRAWVSFIAKRAMHHAARMSTYPNDVHKITQIRLHNAVAPFESSESPDKIAEYARNSTTEFFDWLDAFSARVRGASKDCVSFYYDGLKGKDILADSAEVNLWTKLVRQANFARFVANAMAAWGFEYFIEMRQSFVEALDDQDNLELILQEVARSLPHNPGNRRPFDHDFVYET